MTYSIFGGEGPSLILNKHQYEEYAKKRTALLWEFYEKMIETSGYYDDNKSVFVKSPEELSRSSHPGWQVGWETYQAYLKYKFLQSIS